METIIDTDRVGFSGNAVYRGRRDATAYNCGAQSIPMEGTYSARNGLSGKLQPAVFSKAHDETAIIAPQADIVTGVGVHSELFVAAAQDDTRVALLSEQFDVGGDGGIFPPG